MRIAIKDKHSFFIDDAKLYNETYGRVSHALETIKKLQDDLRNAEAELVRKKEELKTATEEYRMANMEFHAIQKEIDKLKGKREKAIEKGGDLRRIDNLLTAAHELFYDYYKAERKSAGKLTDISNAIVQLEDEILKLKDRIKVAPTKLKIEMGKLYGRARKIEERYGFSMNSKRLLNLSLNGDENSTLDGIEMLDIRVACDNDGKEM